MNKAAWILGGIVLAAALFGAYSFVSHRNTQPMPAVETPSGNAAVGANGASSIITYTDTGFAPSPLTVAVGTTVTWTNQSSRTLWIEGTSARNDCSNATHTTLNQCKAVSRGGTYSYTFTTPGTNAYGNHEHTTDAGAIMVTSAGAAGPINPKAVPQ